MRRECIRRSGIPARLPRHGRHIPQIILIPTHVASPVKSRFIFPIILILFAASPAEAQKQPHRDSTAHAKKEEMVYITRKGNKYHRDSCRFLAKSKIQLPLSEAKKYYQPCKVCKPPE